MLGSTALQMGKLSQMVAVGRVWGGEGSCQLCARFYDIFFSLLKVKKKRELLELRHSRERPSVLPRPLCGADGRGLATL